MTKPERDTVIPALRQWLRNERRLGVPHWPLPPASPGARSALTPAGVLPTPGGARSPTPDAETTSPLAIEPRNDMQAQARGPWPAPATPGLFPDDPNLPPLCARDLSPDEAAAALARLDADFVRACTKCRLHQHRAQTVFGVGHPRPDLVFVGEGPGADEDEQGVPFVGRAGQLLTRMIAAMTLTREQVYICNVVKCRPPENRTPLEDEMETCSPYLFRQLAILRPKVIVALGRPAAQTLLRTKAPISKLRGQFHHFPPPALAHLGLPATKLMPTYHPAYLLRNPAAKTEAWEDLQQVMQVLGLKAPGRRR